MKVRITGGKPFYHEGERRLVGPGEVVEMHGADAVRLIAAGEAEHVHRGRSLRDNLIVGNRQLGKGEEFLGPEDRIKALVVQGVVEDLGPAPAARPAAAGAESRTARRK